MTKGKGWKGLRTAERKRSARHAVGSRYTIDDVIEINQANGGHFFSRENMKHHGETRRDFKVYRDGEKYMVENKKTGKVYEFNPLSGSITYRSG